MSAIETVQLRHALQDLPPQTQTQRPAHELVIDRIAAIARLEIKVLAERARRSIGQLTRRGREW
jgi:hypothetical protein